MKKTIKSSVLLAPPINTSSFAAIHSTSSHGSYYLFSLIDSALWLLANEKELKKVEIILHPVDGIHTPQSIILGFKYRLSQLPRFIISAPKLDLKRLKQVKPFEMFLRAFGNQSAVTKSIPIFDQVYRGRFPVALNTETGTIIVHRSARRPIRSLKMGIRTYVTARRLWRICHENNIFKPQKLLHLDYRGVLVGDLVASTALRKYPQSGGSLQACPGLFPTLLNAVAICDYIATNILIGCHQSYVTIPESSYLHALYLRMLHKQGACALYLHHYEKEFVVLPPEQQLYNPNVVQVPEPFSPLAEDVLRAKTYLHERINQPNKHLWYMFEGVNRSDQKLWDLDNNLLKPLNGGLSVIVFLHSFDDGQYLYGVDGFDDLYHWTTFTIDHLVANEKVSKVYIKPHPNSNYSYYRGDQIAFDKLRHRYSGNQSIIWLRKDCSPMSIAQLNNVVGVTHHGSIAEELTYLGIPIIASSFAPWGNSFSFVNVWRSPEEYETLLINLSSNNSPAPSPATIDELLAFVVAYRLNAVSLAARTAWFKFALCADGLVPKCDTATMCYYSQRLAKLAAGDALTSGFLEWLLSTYRSAQSKSRIEYLLPNSTV